MTLVDPIRLGGREAPTRLLFGPHETNLARGRAISERHAAYYARRAAGGAGVIVIEEASVHESDWPYERAPLAEHSIDGWRLVTEAVRSEDTGTLVIAALGHAGGQGSSAYNQMPLLAPSRVPEVNSREVPKWMEDDDIAAVISGFGAAARGVSAAGLDGVEINAGQNSLIRQFLSGLTNMRDDKWGNDRLAFAQEVIATVRTNLSSTESAPIVGLRLSCDELAPWAGITPEAAADVAVALAPLVDYLVVVRGSIFTLSATRPDFHEAPGFNRDLCAQITLALRAAEIATPIVLQGSVIDPAMANDALEAGICDLVEMTRAQIADPALGNKVASGMEAQIRPCVLCNQLCMVRDPRNPIVSCIVEPSSGHETDEPAPLADGIVQPPSSATGSSVLVVGAGPAGLEAARTAALLGHHVRVVEKTNTAGSRLRFPVAGSGNPHLARFADWLVAETKRLQVDIAYGQMMTPDDLGSRNETVLAATGSVNGNPTYKIAKSAQPHVMSAADLCAIWLDTGEPRLPNETQHDEGPVTVVVFDPIGGPIGVAVAQALATRPATTVHLVTQDQLAGNELARTGDLASANARLQQAGVVIERRSVMRAVGAPDKSKRVRVTIEDRFTGETRNIRADWFIDAGFRLPDDAAWPMNVVRVGDAVAPRTIHEAILEARRAVLALHVDGGR